MEERWTIEDSEKLYHIREWGEPYFSINESGNITINFNNNDPKILDLYKLIKELELQNIKTPLLISFYDILSDRLACLQKCFNNAIENYNYSNIYQGVFPLKCNPYRPIVQALMDYGKQYNFGLECGSKPELMIALTHLQPQVNSDKKSPKPCIICNGYKDKEYIETALLSNRLGHNIIIVIEQLKELDIIIKLSNKLQIKPTLGIRAKLSTKSIGRWDNSSGDSSKFGLKIREILTVIKQLEKDNMLNCLQLLHFHIGSQISSISVIKYAIREASQIYVQLVKLGANMRYLDVGGGLAVDYDGAKTNFYASKNYNMQNYANDIVAEVQQVCKQSQVNEPILISESGRAIASHHSVIIFNVLNTSNSSYILPKIQEQEEHLVISNLWETYEMISEDNYQECYHDIIQYKEEAINLFNLGYLSLEGRARAEQIYETCCQKILKIISNKKVFSDDFKDLENFITSIYYINISLFKSIPDSWAINQLFPIIPIHRLDEKPNKQGILADLTCDSDGKIDKFIDLGNIKSSLPLHDLPNINQPNDETKNIEKNYYLGVFLVGAYQEIMGNVHNLFGDQNTVYIKLNEHGYEIEQFIKGETIRDVLQYVQYNSKDLLDKMRSLIEDSLKNNLITEEYAQILLSNYEKSLNYYTYLMSDN